MGKHLAALCPVSALNGSLVAGSVNVSNILNGKCVSKVQCSSSDPNEVHALQDVTALFYNEERNEIYTGNTSGMVHVWSN